MKYLKTYLKVWAGLVFVVGPILLGLYLNDTLYVAIGGLVTLVHCIFGFAMDEEEEDNKKK